MRVWRHTICASKHKFWKGIQAILNRKQYKIILTVVYFKISRKMTYIPSWNKKKFGKITCYLYEEQWVHNVRNMVSNAIAILLRYFSSRKDRDDDKRGREMILLAFAVCKVYVYVHKKSNNILSKWVSNFFLQWVLEL